MSEQLRSAAGKSETETEAEREKDTDVHVAAQEAHLHASSVLFVWAKGNPQAKVEPEENVFESWLTLLDIYSINTMQIETV